MNSNASIIWQGNTYDKFPIAAEGFEYSGRGTLPRPTITVSNVLGTITALMSTVNATTPFNDLQGAKFVRIRTLSRFLDAANFPSNQNPLAHQIVQQNCHKKYILLMEKLSKLGRLYNLNLYQL